MSGGSTSTLLRFPTRHRKAVATHLVYCHGDPYWVDPREPVCPVCGKKVKVVW